MATAPMPFCGIPMTRIVKKAPQRRQPPGAMALNLKPRGKLR